MESTEKSSCFIINLTRRAKDHTCLNFLINKAKPTFSFIKFNKQSLLNSTNVTLISQPHPKNGILEKQNYCFFKRLKIKEKIINENKKTGKDSIFGKTEWKKKKRVCQPHLLKWSYCMKGKTEAKWWIWRWCPSWVRSQSRFSLLVSMSVRVFGWLNTETERRLNLGVSREKERTRGKLAFARLASSLRKFTFDFAHWNFFIDSYLNIKNITTTLVASTYTFFF